MSIRKVEGHDNLVRDMSSKAILNTDRKALEEYYKQREFAKKELNEKNEMKNRLVTLESDMQEIKSMLLELVQRKA
tara:strand:- start:26 stop:253 length:228 start_codon:yes stop_codon:yes gene_type:complete